MTSFKATHISVTHEDDYLLVGFADDEFDAGEYLMLQRAYEFDEQDTAHGMDTVYIERNDQSQSTYGGITRVLLAQTYVQVMLTATAADALACDQMITIIITAIPQELTEVHAALAEICRNVIPYSADPALVSVIKTAET